MAYGSNTRRMVTLAASLGWFFDAYVITIYALTVPLIAIEFHVSTVLLSGTVGSIFLVGYTIGTIGFGVCGDAFGRRVMLGISMVAYGVITALTAFATGIVSLATFRFLTGVGGGGELSIGSPYVTEVWGKESRGRGIGLMYAFYPAGYLFAELMFFVLTPTFGWRAVYAFAVLPALVILAMRMRLEESPRFNTVLSELKEEVGRRVGLGTALRSPVYRKLLFCGFLIFVSLTYSYYALAFYIAPFLVHSYGMSPTRGVVAVLAIFSGSALVGGLAGGVLADRFGRRKPAMVLALFAIALTFGWWATIWPPPVFCMFAAAVAIVGSAEWTLGIVYVNELFPTEIRASGFGWSSGLGRIVSIVAPMVTQMLAVSMGVAHAIQVSGFIWLSLFVGYLISHETAGIEIEDRVAIAEPLTIAIIPGQETR
jgi:MFS transporter, putative metabolite:H+ symporter